MATSKNNHERAAVNCARAATSVQQAMDYGGASLSPKDRAALLRADASSQGAQS